MAMETLSYLFAAYIAGLFVVVPGIVIGKHSEHPESRPWHFYVAVLVVGAVVIAPLLSRSV